MLINHPIIKSMYELTIQFINQLSNQNPSTNPTMNQSINHKINLLIYLLQSFNRLQSIN